MKNTLQRDNFSEAQKVAALVGKKLSYIQNALTGEFLGYRLTSNGVRCHFERVVGMGKIRKLLGMADWKYVGGVPVATYPDNGIARVINAA